MENPPLKSIVSVFSFFLLLLTGFFIFSVIGDIKAIQTKSWPTTDGTVISSSVKRGSSSKGSSKYLPDITYAYVCNGEEYSSNKYSSTAARGSSFWAKDVTSKYPPNASVKVYYNPNNPKSSVLKTGLTSDNYWMTIISLFFIIVVLLAFIKQLKDRKAAVLPGTNP